MNKNEIGRNDLKKDFLKQTIVRIDYDYIFDDCVEKTMKNIDEFLSDKRYSIKNSFMSQFGLKVDFDKLNNNLDTNIMDTINVESDKREKFFSFINEEKNIKIDITHEYSAITIDYVKHVHFDEINEIFSKIIEELQKARKNLQIKRVGLRKVNIYMLKNLEKLTDYFEDHIYTFASSNLDTYQFIGKNSYDNFIYNGYTVNQIANIAQGYMQTPNGPEPINQLALDFDVYIENPVGEVPLEDMNNSLFEIYKNSLKEQFLNELTNENFSSEEIF